MKLLIRRSGHLLVLSFMMIGPAPVDAEIAAASSEDSEGEGASVPAAGGGAPARSAASVANERIVVEGSLPYIPTANMIATRLPIELRWTPTNVGTVNEPVLQEQLSRVLGEALVNVSGVNPQTQSGVADYFTVRGFDSLSGTLVLTDGAPEPEVSVYQMYNVERVEVLKGPGGFLYGRNGLSGALAGIVNIVRRQPEPASFGGAGVSYGSFNTAQIDLDTNVAPKDSDLFSFRINAMYRESDFYRDDKENETTAFNPAFAWRVGEDTQLNLSLEYADLKFSPDSGIPLLNNALPDVDRRNSYQSADDFSDQTIGRFQFDAQTDLSSSWSLRNKVFYRDLDWRTDGTIFTGFANSFNPICPPSPTTTEPEVCRVLTSLDDDQEFVGNQFEVVWDGEGGGVGFDVLMGLELARYGDAFTISAEAISSMTLYSQMQGPALPPLPPLSRQAGDSRSLVAAPYVIGNFDFNERFKMLAGARFDFIDFEDAVTSDSRSDSDVSPMLGLTFGLSDLVNIYASASEAFAPPSGRVAGDPVPEESQQIEIGTKLGRAGGKVQTTVALYQLERENIGIVDATGFTQQAGDQRSRGLEIEFAAEPRPRLRTFVSYAYNDAELTRFSQCALGIDTTTGQCFPNPFGSPTVDLTGNTASFAPEHMANAWVSQRFGNGWGVGGGLRYVDSQFIAEDNQARIGAYLLLDGAVYYTLDRWDLSLNFRNITDETYEIRGFGSGSVIPADPFTVFAGADYRF